VLAASDANTNSLYIYKVDNAGTILKQLLLDSTTRSTFSSLDIDAFSKYDAFSIGSTTSDLYLTVKVPSSEFGVMKFTDFFNA